MSHKNGTFNVIETRSDTKFGIFNFKYVLSAEAKVIPIKNLPDINNKLIKTSQYNIISEYVDSGKREFLIASQLQ